MSRGPAAGTKCLASGCLPRRPHRTRPSRSDPPSEADSRRSGRARPADRTASGRAGRPASRKEAVAPANRVGKARTRTGALVTSEQFPRFIRTRSGLHRGLQRCCRQRFYPFSGGEGTGRKAPVKEDSMTTLRSCSWATLCLAAVTIPAKAVSADVVLDWNAHAAQAIVTAGGQVPPRALIRLAMVHLAIYDAVNAIEGAPFEGYASVPAVDRPASEEAATAAASHDDLVALFPAQVADLCYKDPALTPELPEG